MEKVKKGLSAGRVQSVALKLIIDREEEINAFQPEEYWTIDGTFKKGTKQFPSQFLWNEWQEDEASKPGGCESRSFTS